MRENERTAFLKDLDRVINEGRAVLGLQSGVVFPHGRPPMLYVVNSVQVKRSAEVSCELVKDQGWAFTWDRDGGLIGSAGEPDRVARVISLALNVQAPPRTAS